MTSRVAQRNTLVDLRFQKDEFSALLTDSKPFVSYLFLTLDKGTFHEYVCWQHKKDQTYWELENKE
jgi:hypothetical protein